MRENTVAWRQYLALADRKALVLALLLFPISLQWETTTKQARMLCYLLITLVFYVAGLFSWELPVTSSPHSFPTVKHGCAKLFGKLFRNRKMGQKLLAAWVYFKKRDLDQ